jgi:hypothetical protein
MVNSLRSHHTKSSHTTNYTFVVLDVVLVRGSYGYRNFVRLQKLSLDTLDVRLTHVVNSEVE